MSFRMFIYYCAFTGGWAALFGWILGRGTGSSSGVFNAGIKGMFLGMLLAAGLGLVDALLNLDYRQIGQILMRVGVTVVVGCFGGLIGGVIGQAMYGWTDFWPFLVVGWTITGFLIGAAIGTFDILARVMKNEDLHGAMRKVINGVLGGTVGGLLGGILSVILRSVWTNIFSNKPSESLWSPSALGFVALGMCIGLLIGLAQVILKEAWVRVEAGFRAGREMILSKPETTVGRAESCDIGLFGDPKCEKLHARIVLQANRYMLVDNGTPGGTYLNGQKIRQPAPLTNGDAIQVGNSVLRFGTRGKGGAKV
jgi:Inner membrane component of T3SS, cytoplasmic domain